MKYKIYKCVFVHCGCERSAVIGNQNETSKQYQAIYQEMQQAKQHITQKL